MNEKRRLAMKVETIHIRIEDDSERNYFRAVWYLVTALRAVGAADRVLPALHELFERAVADRHTATVLDISDHVARTHRIVTKDLSAPAEPPSAAAAEDSGTS
jgi:hypothetical protein